MEKTDLTFRIVAAVGSMATFLTLLRLIYGDYFKRPSLELSFDPTRDVRDQVTTPALKEGEFWDLSRWVRICVINKKGRRVAKNARAFLVGIQPVVGVDELRDDGRSLPWQNDYHRPIPRDLHPGVKNWVDVAFTIAGDDRHILPCARPPAAVDPGEYRFAIQVTADEAEVAMIYAGEVGRQKLAFAQCR